MAISLRFCFSRMHLVTLLVLAVWSFPLQCAFAVQAPSPAERQKLLQESIKAAEKYVAVVRPQVFRNLTGREHTIYDAITFEITDLDSAWQASGSVDPNGDRFVKIDVGYVRSIEIMTDALFLEELRNQEFLSRYVRYVASQLQQKATFIQSPYDFIGMSKRDQDEFFDDTKLQKQRVAAVANSVAFVLAHEVGHHVLGHYEHPPQDNQARVSAERDADAWAIHQLLSTHFPPMAGIVPLLFDFYYAPLGDVSGGTHPTSLERVHALFEAMREAAPQFRGDVEAHGGSYADFKRSLDGKLTELESQMKAGSAFTDSTGSGGDPFCSAVQTVLTEGNTHFRRLAGMPDPDGESFEAPVLLPGAERCRVWQYRDRSLGSAVVCHYGRSASRDDVNRGFEQLAIHLRACLTGWHSRSFDGMRQRKLEFSGSTQTRVRLQLAASSRRADYLLEVWFDRD